MGSTCAETRQSWDVLGSVPTLHFSHLIKGFRLETSSDWSLFDAIPQFLLCRLLPTNTWIVLVSPPTSAGSVDSAPPYFGDGHDGHAAQVEEPTSFGPNLATLSMLSPVEMTLTPAEEDTAGTAGTAGSAGRSQFPAMVMIPSKRG